MQTEAVVAYFRAERAESMVFVGMGLAALALGLYLLRRRGRTFARGLAFPLVAVALIQLTVGATIFLRSPKDIVRVEGLVAAGGTGIRQEEIPRMQQVMRSFAWYKYAELALMAAGALLFLPGSNPFRWGIGAGLFLQASLMLAADYFAIQRGQAYLDYLVQTFP